MNTPVLDYGLATFIGAPIAHLGDINPETGKPFINQNGVKPGLTKLQQFRQALKLRGTPPLYSQEELGDDAIVHVKLFDPCGSASWFITEFSLEAPDGCTDLAFGYVTGLGEDELGYIGLEELANTKGKMGIGLEINTWFSPCTLREIKEKQRD